MEQKIDIIDFHSHILPSADHGSDSLDTSLKQLELAKLHGVSRIVATTHFYPDRHNVESFLARRDGAWTSLNNAKDSTLPRVARGAEVLICDGIERLEGIEKLCIEGTTVLLLELPFTVFKTEYRNSVFHLIKKGFTVVLAHADRYDPDDIDVLLGCGAKIQLNADALSGFLVKRHIKDWIMQGYVVAIGSDIHLADKRAYKNFEKAKKRLEKIGALGAIKSAGDNMKIIFS